MKTINPLLGSRQHNMNDEKIIPVSFNIKSGDYSKALEIAKKLGYTYGKKGQLSSLISAIANGEIILIQRSDLSTSKKNDSIKEGEE